MKNIYFLIFIFVIQLANGQIVSAEYHYLNDSGFWKECKINLIFIDSTKIILDSTSHSIITKYDNQECNIGYFSFFINEEEKLMLISFLTRSKNVTSEKFKNLQFAYFGYFGNDNKTIYILNSKSR